MSNSFKSFEDIKAWQMSRVFMFKSQSGIAALLAIVVISAAALVMAYTAAMLSVGELNIGYASQKGGEAFAFTDGCVNEAVHRLRLDDNYAGGNLNVSEGSCIINVSGSGGNRTIVVTGTVGSYNKKIQADITIAGSSVNISSWQELTD